MMRFSVYHPILLFIVIIWGFNVVAIKYLVQLFSPITITSFRILIAGAVILLFLLLRRQSIFVPRKQFMLILMISIFGVVGHHFFLATGLHQTTASNAGIILGLVPLVTSMLSVVFLHVHLTFSKLIGFIIGFLGVIFIIVKNPQTIHSITLGDLYIFFSVVSQGISFILIKKATQSLSPAILTGWMFTLGSLGLFMISMVKEPTGIDSLFTSNLLAWSVFLASAIISTAVGHLLYNKAMQKIGSIDAAVFINLSPFFTLLGSVLFLGETLHWNQILGFVFVVSGVLLGIGLVASKPIRISQNRK